MMIIRRVILMTIFILQMSDSWLRWVRPLHRQVPLTSEVTFTPREKITRCSEKITFTTWRKRNAMVTSLRSLVFKQCNIYMQILLSSNGVLLKGQYFNFSMSTPMQLQYFASTSMILRHANHDNDAGSLQNLL